MKSISIRQPYASWLANPDKFLKVNLTPKRIENRNWITSYRGPILIHASKTFEHDALDIWAYRMPAIGKAFSLDPKDYPLGAIIGIAELVKVVTQMDIEVQNPWFFGPYGFVLKNARPIEPIVFRGMPGLFEVSESVLEEYGAQ